MSAEMFDEVERLREVLRAQVKVNVRYTAREVEEWKPLLAAAKEAREYLEESETNPEERRVAKALDATIAACEEKGQTS